MGGEQSDRCELAPHIPGRWRAGPFSQISSSRASTGQHDRQGVHAEAVPPGELVDAGEGSRSVTGNLTATGVLLPFAVSVTWPAVNGSAGAPEVVNTPDTVTSADAVTVTFAVLFAPTAAWANRTGVAPPSAAAVVLPVLTPKPSTWPSLVPT
jgi:hypothetical protein